MPAKHSCRMTASRGSGFNMNKNRAAAAGVAKRAQTPFLLRPRFLRCLHPLNALSKRVQIGRRPSNPLDIFSLAFVARFVLLFSLFLLLFALLCLVFLFVFCLFASRAIDSHALTWGLDRVLVRMELLGRPTCARNRVHSSKSLRLSTLPRAWRGLSAFPMFGFFSTFTSTTMLLSKPRYACACACPCACPFSCKQASEHWGKKAWSEGEG